ncbi:mitochondrial dynamin GTPase Msp1 [Lithohypha guttulata]|uniref:Mitochondrial dynamin GTPase Msp1 n=1 Tax=Lithohypha guttulata TaxID=1690604 RepID=A0AAN7T1F4_9EURO|nr:mitochondrial dynamin GTPase Msp1 [Lithohypha guttulata]
MAPDRGSVTRAVREVLLASGATLAGYVLIRYLLKQINSDPDQERARLESAAILKRLDAPPSYEAAEPDPYARPQREELKLNQYEQVILQDLVFPEDIPVGFDDIGGLSNIIEELKESVIYPLTMPELYTHSSSLLAAPSGVLLYGPPGCGKTMICKALAHESGACFINLHISTLTEKWFGDSNKLVNAVFSLARKLQPAIIFIDEIDAVLGTRHSGEHEASGMVKAEFMTWWDGLKSADGSGQAQRILVLGATNRINDIDDAILRRMPKKFPIHLPNASQRLKILKLMLKDTKVDHANLDLPYVARVMDGMSGSDIKESCRDAAMVPVREMIREQRSNGRRMNEVRAKEVRGLKTDDFFANPKKTPATVTAAEEKEEWSTASSSPAPENERLD